MDLAVSLLHGSFWYITEAASSSAKRSDSLCHTSHSCAFRIHDCNNKPHPCVSGLREWHLFLIHGLRWVQLSILLLCVLSERTPWPLAFRATRKGELAKPCVICRSFLDVAECSVHILQAHGCGMILRTGGWSSLSLSVHCVAPKKHDRERQLIF